MSLAFEDFAEDEAVSVVVTNPTYLNGYGYRRTLRVAGAAITGAATLVDLPLRFDEILASLKSVANGGNVQSSLGWDIRFEAGTGAQLDHELETYDPVTGRAACWVRLPSATPGVDQDIFLYYGQAGVAGPEEDTSPTGTWQRCLGCWRMPDGRDVTGHGRDMTTSGVTSGAIGGHPAAVMTSSSYLELLDTSFMDARSELTAFFLVQPTSSPTGNADFVRFGGTAAGTGRLGFTHYDKTDVAKALRNYVALGGSTAYLIGPANSAVVNHVTTWAVAEKSGDWPVQYLDGLPVASTRSGAFGTGLTSYPSSVLLRIGAGYGDNTTCVPGRYGRLVVFDGWRSADFVAFVDLTIRFPRACYGIGDEDASTDTDRSPVMAPALGSVAVGGSADIDILAHASDPDGGLLTAGLASPSPALGTASIVAGLVRYTRTAAGVDRLGVTATVGAKTARTLLTVATGTVVTPDGDMPVAPRAQRLTAWELVKSSTGSASITEGADADTGVHLIGGHVTTGVSNNAIALVSIKDVTGGGAAGMFTPPFTVSYEYQRGSTDPTPPDGNGIFCQLLFYRRVGASANLASLGGAVAGEWTADYSPGDSYYSAIVAPSTKSRARGIRFSFDTHGLTPTGDNQIRARAIHDDGTVVAFNPATLQTFDFTSPGGWTRLDWSITKGRTVTVTATWSNGGATTQTFNDDEIAAFFGAPTACNVALVAYANRDARFRHADVKINLAGGGVLADYVAAGPILASGDPSRRDVAARGDIPATLVKNLQYTVVNDISFGSAANRDAASNTINVGGGEVGSTCYLRGHVESQDESAWAELSNGTINVSAKSLIIRGLRLRNMRFVLKSGASHVQIESNYISDYYVGYDNGFVHSDGDQTCDRILIAFNRYSDDVARISGCLLRVRGNSTGGVGDAPLNRVVMYRNHIHGFQTGPSQVVSGGDSGRARVLFVGDGAKDTFRDMGLLVQENLCTNWRTTGPFAETKYPGVTFKGNTFEWGVVSSLDASGTDVQKNTPLQIRIRHGRVTQSPTVDIDAGQGAVIDGNLWVSTPGSSFSGSAIGLRDGYHQVTNNWAVSLADGEQPAAASTVLTSGKFGVELMLGNLDWKGFPDNSTPGGGQNFPNAGRCKVGGNHASVTVGKSETPGTLGADECRVADTTGPDKNESVLRSAETNPDNGTVVGADYFGKIPQRLRGGPANGFGPDEYDVGPDAWAASFYGKTQ